MEEIGGIGEIRKLKLIEYKPSILFIAGTLGQGGAEKQLFLLAHNLKQNGHRIAIVVLTSGEYWEEHLVKEGIQVFSNPGKRNRLGRLWWMKNIARSFKPDVIYSFHFYTSIYSGVLRYIMKGKVLTIGSIRNDGYSEIKANGQWSYWMMHLNHLIIANNAHGRRAVIEEHGVKEDRIFILRNAVEIPMYKKRERNANDPIKLLFVGRLVPAKNPMMFLEICAKLTETGIDFIADIIGDGELKEQMKAFIQLNQLEDDIRLLGKISDAEKCFSQYDILVSTSLHEGTPNVILEALASKIFVMSYKKSPSANLLFNAYKCDYNKFCFTNVTQAINIINKIAYNEDKENLVKLGHEFVFTEHNISFLLPNFMKIIMLNGHLKL